MNALHENYAKKGLVVLGISSENEGKLGGWIEQTTAKYPVISAQGATSAYKVAAYPTYYLVSASGRVLAGPQHRHFQAAQIESALRSVLTFSSPPDGSRFDALRKAIAKQRIALVSRELTRLGQNDQLSEAERAKVDTIRGEVASRTKETLEEIATLVEGPDYLVAQERLREIGKQFDGTPVVADVKSMLERFKKDKTIAKELRALKELAAYRRKFDIQKRSGRKKLLKVLDGFMKKHRGTHAAEKAGNLVLKVGTVR